MEAIYDQIKDENLDFDFRSTFWEMTRSDVKNISEDISSK